MKTTKTIKTELTPIAETLENFKKNDCLGIEKKNLAVVEKICPALDLLWRDVMDEIWKEVETDFSKDVNDLVSLYEAVLADRKNKEAFNKYKSASEKLKSKVVDLYGKTGFAKNPIEYANPKKSGGDKKPLCDSKTVDLIESIGNRAGLFKRYSSNRKANVTAYAESLVDGNLQIFVKNGIALQKLSMEQPFSYSDCISQDGIDAYNKYVSALNEEKDKKIMTRMGCVATYAEDDSNPSFIVSDETARSVLQEAFDLIPDVIDSAVSAKSNCGKTLEAEDEDNFKIAIKAMKSANRKVAESFRKSNRRSVDAVKNIYHDGVCTVGRILKRYDVDTSFLDDLRKKLQDVKSYVAMREDDEGEIQLIFEVPTCMTGFDVQKIFDKNLCLIFLRDEIPYLGVVNKHNKFKLDDLGFSDKGDSIFIEFFNRGAKAQMNIPRITITAPAGNGKTFPSYIHLEETVEKGKKKFSYKNPNSSDKDLVEKNISLMIEEMKKHHSFKDVFPFDNLRNPGEYASMKEFYDDVEYFGSAMRQRKIVWDNVLNLVKENKLYLYRMELKDFRRMSFRENPVLQTPTQMLLNLLSKRNEKKNVFSIGGGRISYREARMQEKDTYVRMKGSKAVLHTDTDGKRIPREIWEELHEYTEGHKNLDDLSFAAKAYLDGKKVRYHEMKLNVMKDRRYTQTKFFCSIPISMKTEDLTEFDPSSVKYVIGIDRGSNHLVHYVVMDATTQKIIEERCLNSFPVNCWNGTVERDFQKELRNIQTHIREMQRNWEVSPEFGKYVDDYAGHVVHELRDLFLKYEKRGVTIFALENLSLERNGAFDRLISGKSVESKVYAAVESALVNALSPVLDKRHPEMFWNAKAYTTYVMAGSKKARANLRNGRIFYVQPGYTSKIDPFTGFTPVPSIPTKAKKGGDVKKNDLAKNLRRISNVSVSGNSVYLTIDGWDLVVEGVRPVYDKFHSTYTSCDVGKRMIDLFAGKDYTTFLNNASLSDLMSFAKTFNLVNRMRYMDETGKDFLVSPALWNGKVCKQIHPDANGAWNIARKAVFAIQWDQKSKDGTNTRYKDEDWKEWAKKNAINKLRAHR